jgi:hypothetical protein
MYPDRLSSRTPDLVLHRDLPDPHSPFRGHRQVSEDTVRWITALREHGLTDSQSVALAILREEEALDNRAYRTATGIDARVAAAGLQNQVTRELVTQTGTRRWAQHRLSPRLSSRISGPTATPPCSPLLEKRPCHARNWRPGQASTTRQSGDG